jgi:hypothetical protein
MNANNEKPRVGILGYRPSEAPDPQGTSGRGHEADHILRKNPQALEYCCVYCTFCIPVAKFDSIGGTDG